MEVPKRIRIFGRTKVLALEIDEFFDKLSEAGLVFNHAIKIYLSQGRSEEFEEKLAHVNDLESQADGLRRDIETQLYVQTLIPESRGDVLGLLETADTVLNLLEAALWSFSIEHPNISEDYHGDFQALTDMVVNTVDSLVLASRAFFRDFEAVGDHNHKVMFYEKESDKISTKLKRAIFDSDLPLSEKMHLRHFVELIDEVADGAEDVADRLSIYAIKRAT